MSQDRKQIPFRYMESDLEHHFKQLYKLQYHTEKTNEAIIDAVKISGMIIKKILQDEKTGKIQRGKWDRDRDLIERELRRILELSETDPLRL